MELEQLFQVVDHCSCRLATEQAGEGSIKPTYAAIYAVHSSPSLEYHIVKRVAFKHASHGDLVLASLIADAIACNFKCSEP